MEKFVKTQEVSHYHKAIVGSKTLARLLNLELEDFDFLIEQLTWKDKFSEEDATEAVKEYRKWIALILLARDETFTQTYFGKPSVRLGMPSKHVDNVWHRHILFTKEYAEFCYRINGDMIHHNPCTKSNVGNMSSVKTKDVYQIVFGDLNSIWNEKEDFLKDGQFSCDDVCAAKTVNSAGCDDGCAISCNCT